MLSPSILKTAPGNHKSHRGTANIKTECGLCILAVLLVSLFAFRIKGTWRKCLANRSGKGPENTGLG